MSANWPDVISLSPPTTPKQPTEGVVVPVRGLAAVHSVQSGRGRESCQGLSKRGSSDEEYAN